MTAFDGKGISALTEMEETDRAMKSEAKRTTLAEHALSAGMPIGMWVGYAAPDVVGDPSLLLSLPWAPYYWGAFGAVVAVVVGFVVAGRKQDRRRALKDRVERLAPVAMQGIRDGSITHLTDAQGAMLASVVGERALREALQSSPAFKRPVAT